MMSTTALWSILVKFRPQNNDKNLIDKRETQLIRKFQLVIVLRKKSIQISKSASKFEIWIDIFKEITSDTLYCNVSKKYENL